MAADPPALASGDLRDDAKALEVGLGGGISEADHVASLPARLPPPRRPGRSKRGQHPQKLVRPHLEILGA